MPLATLEPAAPLVRLTPDFIRAKEYLEAIVSSTSDAICTTDTRGNIIYFSPGAEAMMATARTRAVGRPAHRFYAGGRADAERIMRLLRRQGSLRDHEMVLAASDGRRIHVSMSASLLRDREGRVIGTLGISKDISARVALERRLREISITDNLTGLHNQRHLRDKLSQEAKRARRQGYPLSMILMDLDGFKDVNDRLGHLEGDRLLKAFGTALLRAIRSETDSAYRYGGDEFIVLLPGLGPRRAEAVARRIAATTRRRLGGAGLSYGVATLPRSGRVSSFLREADRRMFAMKSRSRGAERPLRRRGRPAKM